MGQLPLVLLAGVVLAVSMCQPGNATGGMGRAANGFSAG